MPITITGEFDSRDVVFSEFIRNFHSRIIQSTNQFHNGIAVVGNETHNQPWKWARIRVTNQMMKSIDVVMSLHKLWLYGYRCVPADESNKKADDNPWLLVNTYKKDAGFSGLEGPVKSLGFKGNYRSYTETTNVSKEAFENAIAVLHNYAQKVIKDQASTSKEIDKAEKCFLIVVLYFAESLRILPVRCIVETGFDCFKSGMSIELGRQNLSLARNWQTISDAFLKGDFSNTEEYNVSNEEEARSILLLLLYSQGNQYELNGIRPEGLGGPGEGPEGGGNPRAVMGNSGPSGNVGRNLLQGQGAGKRGPRDHVGHVSRRGQGGGKGSRGRGGNGACSGMHLRDYAIICCKKGTSNTGSTVLLTSSMGAFVVLAMQSLSSSMLNIGLSPCNLILHECRMCSDDHFHVCLSHSCVFSLISTVSMFPHRELIVEGYGVASHLERENHSTGSFSEKLKLQVLELVPDVDDALPMQLTGVVD